MKIAGGVGGRVVALLTLAAFINYVDRGNLATAAPLIRDEFALSNSQLGLLLSAFFWSYAPGQLLAGWLSERLDARRVLAVGLGVWGVATALTGFGRSFAMLFVLRAMLGIGESAMYPASFKILACEVRNVELGRANGWMAGGQMSGPAFGTLAGGLLMAIFGWRVVFIGAGCISLLWLWPWLLTPRAVAPARVVTGGPPTRALLRNRDLWGSCLGNLGQAYAFYLVLSWLPVYLVKAHGLTMAQMAPVGASVYALSAVTSVLTGWTSDRWLKAGASSNRVRKTALLVGFSGVAVCLCACAFAGPRGAIGAMAGCGLFLGILVPTIWASAQTMAGPDAAARWWGIQNFVANLAGISAPVITGIVVDRTGSFSAAFLVAVGIALIGMFAYAVIVRRIETIDWQPSGAPVIALRGVS